MCSNAKVQGQQTSPIRGEKEENMFGRIRYSIPFPIFIFPFTIGGCLETKDGLAEEDSSAEADFEGFDVQSCECGETPPLEKEPKVENLSPEGESIALTPTSPELEWSCALFSDPVRFTIEEEAPARFTLQMTAALRYCVEVKREQGYLTVRHEKGDVSRHDDWFQWCHELQPRENAGTTWLEVLALTPQTTFTIQLRRGEE